ncbi:uncharacterized protein LOC110448200 isoform X2 [Mizuhopecten yessoensis]|uniref:uncharacterized protein LOC110448200 isoform X2 n=1 Tax=Mizuhopecten yessoensis TaxID=6573 RepID=UPI000B45B83D|nr:uncharacterized protein LOC110448200 isoform X2 [Mizuhopecten yessoensis]
MLHSLSIELRSVSVLFRFRVFLFQSDSVISRTWVLDARLETRLVRKMATKSADLKHYSESTEEKIAKQVFEWVATETTYPLGFYNLVIETSNAKIGTSFSDAAVYLQVIEEVRESVRKDHADGFPTCGLIPIKDILNVSILKDFVANGVKAIEKYPDCSQQSFLALFEFLRERKKHGKALQTLITTTPPTNGNKETQVMVALAHHLFSQLIPGKMYEVDEYAKQVPKECGCGCKARISEGNTSGHREHGMVE